MKKIRIKKFSPIVRGRLVWFHLDSFELHSEEYFGPVVLHIGKERIRMKYTGFGDHKGNAVVQLVLDDERCQNFEEFVKYLNDNIALDMYIEK